MVLLRMAELKNIRGKFPALKSDYRKEGDEWVPIPGTLKPLPESAVIPDVVLEVQQEVTSAASKAVLVKHAALVAAGAAPDMDIHRILIREPKLTWEQSRALVIAALTRFDPAIGQWASDFLGDASRLTRKEVAEGQSNAFATSPGWKGRKRGDITFESDGTISDAIYLAHELGHVLAYGHAQAAGYAGKDGCEIWMPGHVSEVPGMILQYALYDYLMNVQDDAKLKDAAQQHFITEATRSMYRMQVDYAQPADQKTSQEVYEARMENSLGTQWKRYSWAEKRWGQTTDLHRHTSAIIIGAGFYYSGAVRNPEVFDALFKRGKDSDLLDALAKAGITDTEQLKAFYQTAAVAVTKPVEEMHAALPKGQSAAPAVAAIAIG